LHGIVVPIWASRSGEMASFAEVHYRNILRSIDLEFASRNINTVIDVGDQSLLSSES
jgi:hypothetical protein